VYCKYCGKLIGNDVEEVCADCKVKFETPKPKKEGNFKEGLKRAIIGDAFSLTGALILMLAFILLWVAYMRLLEFDIANAQTNAVFPPDLVAFANGTQVFGYVAIPLSIPLIILGLIFGIKSLKVFFKAKNEGRIKPIPTVILGAESTIGAILCFFIIFAVVGFIIGLHFVLIG